LHHSVLHDFNFRDFGFTAEPNAMPAVRMLFEKSNVGSDDALDVWRQLLQLAAPIACGHRGPHKARAREADAMRISVMA
jgi:hypothetical protein